MTRRAIYLLIALFTVAAAIYPGRVLLSLFSSKEYHLLEAPLAILSNTSKVIDIRRLHRPIRDDILVYIQSTPAVTRSQDVGDSYTELSWSDGLISPIRVFIVDVKGAKHKMHSYGYSQKGAMFYLPIKELPKWSQLEGLEINSKADLEIGQIVWCDGNLM
jgi:hypothetical protein